MTHAVLCIQPIPWQVQLNHGHDPSLQLFNINNKPTDLGRVLFHRDISYGIAKPRYESKRYHHDDVLMAYMVITMALGGSTNVVWNLIDIP
jgi:hypothetical protein